MNENQSSWYLFNDSHVSIATFHNLSHLTEQFSRDTAYVLIFARNDVKETDADGSEFIEKTLRQTIEKDNLNFVKVSFLCMWLYNVKKLPVIMYMLLGIVFKVA